MAKSSNSTSLVDDLRQITVLTGGNRRVDTLEYQTKDKQARKATMHTIRTLNREEQPLSFVFPYAPQQIQYSNMSPEFAEISRPGKTPIIAFTRYRARQLSFKFLLAVPLDGLKISIDESIQFLQSMAASATTVYFTNMDKQISNPITVDSESRIFWSISDLNFSSIRRNEVNEITAAEANITLVENLNPTIQAAQLPRITYTSATPQQNRPSTGANRAADFGPTWTQTEAALVSNT